MKRGEVNANFHGPVDFGTGNSADYVAEHAKRARRRGRKPSVSYRDISNPQLALAAAQADILERKNRHPFDRPYKEMFGRVAVIKVVGEPQPKDIELAQFAADSEYAGMVGSLIAGIDVEQAETDSPDIFTRTGTIEMNYPWLTKPSKK